MAHGKNYNLPQSERLLSFNFSHLMSSAFAFVFIFAVHGCGLQEHFEFLWWILLLVLQLSLLLLVLLILLALIQTEAAVLLVHIPFIVFFSIVIFQSGVRSSFRCCLVQNLLERYAEFVFRFCAFVVVAVAVLWFIIANIFLVRRLSGCWRLSVLPDIPMAILKSAVDPLLLDGYGIRIQGCLVWWYGWFKFRWLRGFSGRIKIENLNLVVRVGFICIISWVLVSEGRQRGGWCMPYGFLRLSILIWETTLILLRRLLLMLAGEKGGGTMYSSPEKALTNPFWIPLISIQNGSKGFHLVWNHTSKMEMVSILFGYSF